MTQKDKNLILKDLCGRLLYGVKICCVNWDSDSGTEFSTVETIIGIDSDFVYTIWDKTGEKYKHSLKTMSFKPYLRPMSSMTEEERKEYHNLCYEEEREQIEFGEWVTRVYYHDTIESIDWLNKHHFDYRGLIPKGLALEAPEGMYEDESATQITVGCKIRSKANPDVILRIVSDDCHGDKFECSNGSVLSLEQIKKHYDLYIEENKGTIIIN